MSSSIQHTKSRTGFTLIELLVVLAIIGILIGLLFPAIQSVREAARRTECSNKLRQLGLGALNYESSRRSLPPPNVANTGFSTLGSTFIVLLPYLEQSNRFDRFNLNESIDSVNNFPITREPLPDFLCPSMQRNLNNADNGQQFGEGSYLISYGSDYRGPANGAFAEPPTNGVSAYRLGLAAFRDGTSHTFLFGEIDNSMDWSNAGYSGTLNHVWAQGYWFNAWGHVSGTFNQTRPVSWTQFAEHRTFRSDHPGGVQFCFVDGSIRFVSSTVNPAALRAWVTRSGGEINSDH